MLGLASQKTCVRLGQQTGYYYEITTKKTHTRLQLDSIWHIHIQYTVYQSVLERSLKSNDPSKTVC